MKPVEKLRQLLLESSILMVPGCYDAISAKLIEKAGFQAAFMGGFSVSASRLALPDTGLISYGEMVDQGRNICNAVSIPIFGDGDTGYGNAVNVKRTVEGYASAGFACVMIEDQLWPKRCGHTKGKLTVDRAEAFARIQAAIDAREGGADIMIMARTDANATLGFKEAVLRARTFAEMGADITFLEAPETIDEMKEYCDKVPGLKMANMLEQGKTPVLSPSMLSNIGFNIAAYPLTLLLASVNAVEKALDSLLRNEAAEDLSTFSHLKDIVGFPEYYETEKKYE